MKMAKRNTIDWQVEWLEWHYNKKFNNLYEIVFDEKRNKYNAKISDYAKTIAHLMEYFINVWLLLKYLQIYDQNNIYRDRLRNIAIKAASEFRIFHTRKGVNRAKHIKYCVYDFGCYDEFDNIKNAVSYLECIPEDKTLELAHLYQQKLDELIEIIANDDISMEDHIEQEFFS